MTSCVIIESPYRGNDGSFANVKYSRQCLRDSLDRGESPFASHLLYTQKGVLDDNVADERDKGIRAAEGWLEKADFVVIYADFGITLGMAKGIAKAARLGKTLKFRWINGVKKIEITEETSEEIDE